MMRALSVAFLAALCCELAHATFFRSPPIDPLSPEVAARLDTTSPTGPALRLSLDDIHSVPSHVRPHYLRKLREASRVHLPRECFSSPDDPNPFAYSGYLTVDPRYDSNLFYWFFE